MTITHAHTPASLHATHIRAHTHTRTHTCRERERGRGMDRDRGRERDDPDTRHAGHACRHVPTRA